MKQSQSTYHRYANLDTTIVKFSNNWLDNLDTANI